MDAEKKQKLEAEGYIFDDELNCFVNKKESKILSSMWVNLNNPSTLQVALSTPHNSGNWKIYLTPEQPHQEIRAALFEKYGKKP